MLVVLLSVNRYYFAQPGNLIGIRNSVGIVLPHGPSMRHLVQGHATTFELDYSSELKGHRKQWYRALNKPHQGIAFYHLNSGNTTEIGSINTLYGYIDFPLIRRKKWVSYLKFGSGISYVQHRFERINNYRNVAIGSKLNMGFVFAYQVEHSFGKWRLGTGLSIVHSSSGAYRLPNLGLNTPSLDLTLKYQLNTIHTKTVIYNDSLDTHYHIDILFSSGIRSTDVLSDKKRMIHTLQIEGRRKSSFVFGFNGGVDVFYNQAIAYLDENIHSDRAIIQLGGKIGVDLILDNKTIFLQMGRYLINESDKAGYFYHRFGGRMTLGKRLIANFSLKTHFAKADYFEIGMGYKLK